MQIVVNVNARSYMDWTRKVERQMVRDLYTAMKRAGGNIRHRMQSAVRMKGSGYKIAGPFEPYSDIRKLLHGTEPPKFADGKNIAIRVTQDRVWVGFTGSAADKARRWQNGGEGRDSFLRTPAGQRMLNRAYYRENPIGGVHANMFERIPEQPQREFIDPIREASAADLKAWVEGALRNIWSGRAKKWDGADESMAADASGQDGSYGARYEKAKGRN